MIRLQSGRAGPLFRFPHLTDHQRPIEETGSPRESPLSGAAVVLSPATTPGGYYRTVSPTFTIPTDVAQSITAGLLSCQRQSGTQLFPRSPGTELLRCTEL